MMAESMKSKMNKIFREIFDRAVRDGSEEERRGMITRARFNSACASALGVRNLPVNTNVYWGQAQDDKYIIIPRPDTLKDELQTYTRARVDPEIWASHGFILRQGEQLQDAIAVKIESSRKRKNSMVLMEEELI